MKDITTIIWNESFDSYGTTTASNLQPGDLFFTPMSGTGLHNAIVQKKYVKRGTVSWNLRSWTWTLGSQIKREAGGPEKLRQFGFYVNQIRNWWCSKKASGQIFKNFFTHKKLVLVGTLFLQGPFILKN